MEVRDNYKEVAKQMGLVGHSLYEIFGESLAEGIWEEFVVLVQETAQYTGSTAASWNLSAGGAADHGQVRVRGLGPDESPLQVGHGAAVSVALNANEGRLDGLGKKIKTSGINIWNDAPGAERAQTGPLRAENSGAEHSLARFKARVATRVFSPLADRNYSPEELNRMAGRGV